MLCVCMHSVELNFKWRFNEKIGLQNKVFEFLDVTKCKPKALHSNVTYFSMPEVSKIILSIFRYMYVANNTTNLFFSKALVYANVGMICRFSIETQRFVFKHCFVLVWIFHH